MYYEAAARRKRVKQEMMGGIAQPARGNFQALMLLLGGAAVILLGVSLVVNATEGHEMEIHAQKGRTVVRKTNTTTSTLFKQQLTFLQEAVDARAVARSNDEASAAPPVALARRDPAPVVDEPLASIAQRNNAASAAPPAALARRDPAPVVDEPLASIVVPEPREPIRDENEWWCQVHHERHKVRPGVSWGTLSKQKRQEWMTRECDVYFCEPHEKAGRGVYKCVPLPGKRRRRHS